MPVCSALVWAPYAYAAENHRHQQIRKTGEIPDGGLYLGGQLARRLQDQHSWPRSVGAELGEHGQGEGRRLASAGLSAADEILSRKDKGNGTQLDGGRLHVTDGAHPIHNCF